MRMSNPKNKFFCFSTGMVYLVFISELGMQVGSATNSLCGTSATFSPSSKIFLNSFAFLRAVLLSAIKLVGCYFNPILIS